MQKQDYQVNDGNGKKAQIIVKEKKTEGYTSWKTYSGYFKRFNKSLFYMVLMFYLIFTSVRLFADFWVSWWAQGKIEGYFNRDYALTYGYLAITLIVCLIMRSSLMAKGSEVAGYNMNLGLM